MDFQDFGDLDVPTTSTNQPCRRCVRNGGKTCPEISSGDTTSTSSDATVETEDVASSSSSTVSPSSKKRKSSGSSQSKKLKSNRDEARELENLSIICPICVEKVTGTEAYVNAHVDECVALKELTTEEYEWAGQSKYRTTFEEAKMFAGSTLVQVSYDNNDNEVDIELENEYKTYGVPQYSETNIQMLNAVSSSTSTLPSPPSPQPSTSSSTEAASSTSDLTVSSLKERVKQLERCEGAT